MFAKSELHHLLKCYHLSRNYVLLDCANKSLNAKINIDHLVHVMIQTPSTSQKKNRIAFTAKHKLDDAAEEYMAAIYRFRKAESEMSDDYSEARCEMYRLEMNLLSVRGCIYRNSIHSLFDHQGVAKEFTDCPKPDWI